MDLVHKSAAEILEVAAAIMDNLMEASTAIDYEKHVRDFTDRAKAVVTEEHLRKVCEKYQSEKGFFGERKPVAIFRRPDSVVVIWKQWFTKQPGEFVAELLLVQKNGKYLVDHVLVF